MKIVSLFDGMACGMLAMVGAGVEVNEYYAYEIDKYAVQTATHNFPNIIECGDVFKADFTQYKDADFIVGGSPCTYWSIAQTNNRETEASGLGWELFSQYIRALNEIKPRFFIYENNKSMSKAIRESITEAFGFDAICINSALVSAQNRQRLYWVGKRNDDGTYSKVDVQQPEDRGILLRDILDNDANLTSRCEKLSDEYYKGCLEGDLVGMIENISVCRNGKQPSQQYRVYSCDGKSVCVDTDQRKHYMIPCNSKDKTRTVYSVSNGAVVIKGKEYPIKLQDGHYIIRKLSINECKKLQTVPEWYEFPVNNAQAYKMLGNGWTVEVIIHLIKSCLTT